jgi:hypothetical protein
MISSISPRHFLSTASASVFLNMITSLRSWTYSRPWPAFCFACGFLVAACAPARAKGRRLTRALNRRASVEGTGWEGESGARRFLEKVRTSATGSPANNDGAWPYPEAEPPIRPAEAEQRFVVHPPRSFPTAGFERLIARGGIARRVAAPYDRDRTTRPSSPSRTPGC